MGGEYAFEYTLEFEYEVDVDCDVEGVSPMAMPTPTTTAEGEEEAVVVVVAFVPFVLVLYANDFGDTENEAWTGSECCDGDGEEYGDECECEEGECAEVDGGGDGGGEGNGFTDNDSGGGEVIENGGALYGACVDVGVGVEGEGYEYGYILPLVYDEVWWWWYEYLDGVFVDV
ncbi:hypothetical protein HK102_010736 [Quaeritorhiza haematococci]|nr:hypothetical protein HK102_010736 [Quaeritorhiza haematococci]